MGLDCQLQAMDVGRRAALHISPQKHEQTHAKFFRASTPDNARILKLKLSSKTLQIIGGL